MTRRKIIKDAIKIYKSLNKDDLKATPYKKHKKGIKRFMKVCKEFQKYNPKLRFGKFDTAYSINDYKNIDKFIIWYDYEDGIEDNEEFYSSLTYKETSEEHECHSTMNLNNINTLGDFIKNILDKENKKC